MFPVHIVQPYWEIYCRSLTLLCGLSSLSLHATICFVCAKLVVVACTLYYYYFDLTLPPISLQVLVIPFMPISSRYLALSFLPKFLTAGGGPSSSCKRRGGVFVCSDSLSSQSYHPHPSIWKYQLFFFSSFLLLQKTPL